MKRLEAAADLETELLGAIETWHERGQEIDDDAFNDLALGIFACQLRHNVPYARYCAARGVTLERMSDSWEAIPPVPAAAFKEAALATFDPARAALVFETSGTTRGTGGRHYMETAALYDAALLAGFDRSMLADGARLRYLNLVPNPVERPESSLGYMMARVAHERGTEKTGWYLQGEHLSVDAFLGDVRESVDRAEPVCIATTAFALAAVLDAAEERAQRFTLARASRIMETGGFKGRARTISREELYSRATRCLGIDETSIIGEYGMTELTSQWYDAIPSKTVIPSERSAARFATSREAPQVSARLKSSPPWLRARAVAADGTTLPDGVVGALVHVDLANLFSCVAIESEDLGATYGREIVLLGREAGAELRGCSLDAEMLLSRP